ncbi:glutathione S-transferase N-terminal domain-containing protein [Algihabitans albus]|uniref:glutathione S-transferase N-terminal domain-containing protein n=1 Tax=Algihabitans albus TaxID=2164067 RepID=UPI000E5C67D6|nr:glutathione S-transferase N-terminal domain-containing protein [Algihabitans albus]
MARKLYERVGKQDNHRPSPFSWRARYALAHKGLDIDDHVPVKFHDKESIAFSGQGFVPILIDGAETVHDSWAIATYLEDSYPDRPSLFGGSQALAHFMNTWADTALMPAVFPLVITDLHANIAEDDKAYFRETREKRLGRTIESFAADRSAFEANLAKALAPLRAQLDAYPYVSGPEPAYADYAVFSVFQFARCVSPTPVLSADDALRTWIDRISALFGGLGASCLRLEEGVAA